MHGPPPPHVLQVSSVTALVGKLTPDAEPWWWGVGGRGGVCWQCVTQCFTHRQGC